jgi:hypothetical protein
MSEVGRATGESEGVCELHRARGWCADWDGAEKRRYNCSMKYSVTIDGQILHFVYIVSLNGWIDFSPWISTAI